MTQPHNPGHYKIPGTDVELIDILKESSHEYTSWDFFLWASMLQYAFRWRRKGTPLDDLRKCRVYLNWLIEAVEKEGDVAEDGEAKNDAKASYNLRTREDGNNLQGGALGADAAPVEEVHK